MEVWKIVPPRKVLSFNLEKQLLDDERTTKQQTYSLPGMTNALADGILKKLRFSHPHIIIWGLRKQTRIQYMWKISISGVKLSFIVQEYVVLLLILLWMALYFRTGPIFTNGLIFPDGGSTVQATRKLHYKISTKSCHQLNRSISLILFKKRVKISSNFRVLPLEARSQTALATCGKQDLQPVNQTISQEITHNFS